MQKTTTFLMFSDVQFGKAEEAIKLYTSLFKNSSIKHIIYYEAEEVGSEQGTVKQATFVLDGTEYMAIDSTIAAKFTFNPAISIYVTCDSAEELETLYEKLSENGKIMMPPDNYGMGKRFAWLADKFGVSWQLGLPE